MECLAFGDPAPRMSWFKDSRRLANDSARLLVDVTDGPYVTSHVVLSHVTRHDAGDYK